MMKFILALFASLAIIGLGQSHQFPDFGKGPLHEDCQDFLDLIPVEKVSAVFADYLRNDHQVRNIVNDPATLSKIKNVVIDLEDISEVLDLINYLENDGIWSYDMVNQINRGLQIKELVPPTPPPTATPEPTTEPTRPPSSTPEPTPEPTRPPTSTPEPTPEPTRPPTSTPEPIPEPTPISYKHNHRTGGLAGLFKDVGSLMPHHRFIGLYVDKLRYSPAFGDLIHVLKNGTLQQIVNKLFESNSFQIIRNDLKNFHVNVKLVEDVMYIIFDVTAPRPPKSLSEDLFDFIKLVPAKEFGEVFVKYLNEDKQVHDAILFLFTPEFHDLLRSLEALKEHKELVVYLEKSGLSIIKTIQELHKIIGMEDYVPPKIEDFLKSQIGAQAVGDGMEGMLKDLYKLLPLDEIDALFQEKLKHSKVFAHFIESLASPEFLEIAKNLANHETFKQYISKTNEKGLDLVDWARLSNRIIGLKWERIFVAF